MEFRILGRTQVGTDDGEVALGGSQRRAVLAVLLVDAGVAVPAERLVDTLWPANPPMSAAQTVQSHVSQLRKVLGAGRIETIGGAYRLAAEPDEVDATAFEQEVELGREAAERGDAANAVSALVTALDRWRGRAFEDAAECARAVTEAARLDALRMSAIEMLLDARLSLGQHDQVAADAEAATSAWPLRERLWGSLMLALYRCGRQADALSAYQRLRTTLSEELGLEPSPAVAELEGRILRHDSSLLLAQDAGGREPVASVAGAAEVPERPGNLPLRTTSFIGRERETEQVAEALSSTRLVTLTGVGGVGKTRLAVHVAGELASIFEEGAWLCELASVDSPESLLQAISAAVGAPTRAGVGLTESLVDFLRAKRLLLVLDNCEHLLTSAGDLAEALLEACPDVRVLATSREGLAVEGELVMPLRSLGLPPAAADPAGLAQAAAVRLFYERARAGGADLSSQGDDLRAVAEICRRLDGVPLALELAAARAVAMSPADIAARLDERFRLLTGGRRSAVERHQTLRAAVDWSYGSLSDRDRSVFDRLGVFAGGFDLAAAQGVLEDGEISDFEIVDALTSLVAKSMVVADGRRGGAARYRLLETMRQYARDRLDESGDADGWRRRHAAHYLELARMAGPGFQGPDEITWRQRIGDDLDNLRAAVIWALDRDDHADAQLGLQIIVALVNEGVMRRSSGIAAWSSLALQRRAEMTAAQEYDVRAGVAWDLFQSGDLLGALDMAQEAVAHGTPDGVTYTAGAFIALATTRGVLGDLDGARAAFAQGREAAAGSPDEGFSMAALLSAEAMITAGSGDLTGAGPLAEEALRIARQVRNPTVLVMANYAHGWALTEEDPSTARAALEECIALSNAGAIDGTIGAALARVAPLRLRQGDPTGAVDALLTGLGGRREIGDRTSLASVIDSSVGVLYELGAVDAAALAGTLLEQLEVRIGPQTAVEPGRRQQILDQLRSEHAHTLDAAIRTCDQLSTDEVLDQLVEELTRQLAGGRMPAFTAPAKAP